MNPTFAEIIQQTRKSPSNVLTAHNSTGNRTAMCNKVIWKIYEIQNRFDDNIDNTFVASQNNFLYQKFKSVISQNEIKSNL